MSDTTETTAPDKIDLDAGLPLSPEPAEEPSPPATPYRKIDATKCIELYQKGVSVKDISKWFDCSKSAVSQTIKRYIPGLVDTKAYNKNREIFYTALESNLLDLTPEEMKKKMTPYQRIGAAGLIYDKRRLETGQSTENIALMVNGSPALTEAVKAAADDYLKRLMDGNGDEIEEAEIGD